MKRQLIVFALTCLLVTSGYAESVTNEKSQQTSLEISEVLGRLDKEMSGMQTLQTSFVEEKKLAVFDRAIILKGRMFLQKPRFFAWHVEEPIRYSLVIKGDMLRQWDEDTGEVQQMSLAKNPVFQTIVEQMTRWFSGTYVSLADDYKVTILNRKPLCIEFIPRENAGAHNIISRLKVTFREDERCVQKLYIEEKNGDSTLITFVNTVLNAPVDATAWEVKPHAR